MKLPACVSLVLVLVAASTLAAGEERVLDDGWYALYFGGAKSGWMHEWTIERGEGDAKRFVTRTEFLLQLKRARTEMTIRDDREMEEDATGRVVRFRHVTKLGRGEQVTRGVLLPDGRIAITHGTGEPIHIAYPDGALGPAAVARRIVAAGIVEGREVSVPVFIPEFLGTPVTQHTVVGGLETVDLLGRKTRLRKVVLTYSNLPGLLTVTWVDAENRLQAMDSPAPGVGQVRMIRTARAVALREGEPTEMFTTLFVSPDRVIEKPRTRKRIGYRLSAKDGELPDLPTGVGQTVRRDDGGDLVVVLDLTKPVPDGYDLPCRDEAMKPWLRSNRFLQTEDARVIALAREAVGKKTNAVAAARAIERTARKRIVKKNLNVVFATAAEVAEFREGDCSEHAVLCAAMARAVGLPSRVVLGLVYLPPGSPLTGKTGAFGYHMWTEVWVGDDTWMSIDAAMPGMDATHLAIDRSGLDAINPLVDLALPMLGIIGNLEITVLTAR